MAKIGITVSADKFTYYNMSKSANLHVLRTTKKSRSEPSERLLFKLNKKYLSTLFIPQ